MKFLLGMAVGMTITPPLLIKANRFVDEHHDEIREWIHDACTTTTDAIMGKKQKRAA